MRRKTKTKIESPAPTRCIILFIYHSVAYSFSSKCTHTTPYIVNSHGITSHHIALHLLVKVKGALRRTSLIILNFMPF